MGTEFEMTAPLPEPPLPAEVTLQGYTTLDIPLDWHGEDWALPLSDAVLGLHYRLIWLSLRQSPAGSIPGDPEMCRYLLQGNVDRSALDEALDLWPAYSDGRRYWPRLVSIIEAAWARYKGKQSKDAVRKRRERLASQLRQLGLTDDGSRNADVLDAVIAQMPQGAKLSMTEVRNAAMAAGIIGPVRKLSESVTRTVSDSPRTVLDSIRTVHGQSRDSFRTVLDSPNVSEPEQATTSCGLKS